MQESTDNVYNDLFDSFSPPPSPHTQFFYTYETEQVFIGTLSRSNGHCLHNDIAAGIFTGNLPSRLIRQKSRK